MARALTRIQELETAENEDSSEVAKKRQIFEQELTNLKGDLLYIKHFPTTKKYISIFGQEEKSVKQRERIKKQILAKFSEKEDEKKSKIDSELSQETNKSALSEMQQSKKGKSGEREKATSVEKDGYKVQKSKGNTSSGTTKMKANNTKRIYHGNNDREEEQEEEETTEESGKIKAEDTEEDSQLSQDDLEGDDFFLPKAEKLD